MAVEVAGKSRRREKFEELRTKWDKYFRLLTRLAVTGGVAFSLLFTVDHFIQHDFSFTRPMRINSTEQLYDGVIHIREVHDSPRNLMINILEIEVGKVDFLVSPPVYGAKLDSIANTASRFLREHGLQVVINANFFQGYKPGLTFFSFPQIGDEVDALGQVISNGTIVSEGQKGYPALCLVGDKAKILEFSCTSDTKNAIAGNERLIKNGLINPELNDTILHPRVAAGVSTNGKTLWLVVIDGRQPGYSEGATLAELAMVMFRLGAVDAIVLDGGGSATLVSERGRLSSPVQNRVSLQERPVGTLMGIGAEPSVNHKD